MLLSYDPNDSEGGLKLLEDLTVNARPTQDQVLDEILTRNARTGYLKTYLNGRVDKGSFKTDVPVVNYEDIKPYIERLANGDSSEIISAEPITELLTSSGTSGGQPKMMPSTAEDLDRKTFFYNLLVPVINKYVDGLDQGKGMYLLFVKPEVSTPSGLMARPVLTSYYKSINFRNRPYNRFNILTSPDETILCPDSKQSMFCQLLCGLVQRGDVLRVGAVFASAFLRAVKFLESHWQELCDNIKTGTVNDWITDSCCRTAVQSVLKGPNPELADSVEAECVSKSWEGIIRRLWPRTKYIEVIVTGSMAQYIPTLEFYSGGLPLISTMYASSECYFGINFKPLSKPCDVSYTLLPNMAYFEFLAIDKSPGEVVGAEVRCNGNASEEEKPEPVDLVDVKIGHYYELIVTTYTGLYRYRVGDILMVTGFYNAAPQFRFIQRQNVVLSIDTDKTSEDDLLKAITEAKHLIEPLGFLLTEYTSYPDTTSIPGHYVLFWELKSRTTNLDLPEPDRTIMEQCCAKVEECLDSVYRRCRRKDKSIGALEIRVVKEGTFDALMDYCVSQGSSLNQYKTPRCIKSEEALRILNSRVVGSFGSKEVPAWEPFNMENKNNC